jgi:hypothetical protein
MKKGWILAGLVLTLAPCLLGADNLALNPNLDFAEHNKKQGRLITGTDMDDGLAEGKVNYIIFYMEKCYNAKRQARVTVHLYEKYKDRVHFVVVDLDRHLSPAQKIVRQRFCSGVIPHITVLDKKGNAVFDFTGEADETTMSGWLDYALRMSETGESQTAAR